MSVKRLGVVTGLLYLWASTCGAAPSVGQGTIEFTGSIVETGCATNARSGAVLELTGCAEASRGGDVDVRGLKPVASVDAAHVLLVADARSGRYYNQRYVLVDGAGKPIQSGNYVVTLTTP